MIVKIVQPTVPHYRIAFFQSLGSMQDLELKVYASKSIGNGPKSVGEKYEWLHVRGRVISFLGGRLLYQHGIDADFRSGENGVLVICGNPRFISNYLLWLKAKINNWSVVWWGHGCSPTSGKLSSMIRRNIMKLADVVVLYTENERKEYLNKGFDKDKLFGLNNTIDKSGVVNACSKWDSKKLAAFSEDQKLEGFDIILTCGRIIEKSRLHILIECITYLKDISVKLVVIGDGDYSIDVKKYADKLGVARNIIWVGAQYSEHELAPWFLSANCFVYPGAIGLSLLHSFAYSLPVITHNQMSCHNPEISALKDGQNGMLFNYDDPKDLASKISILLGSNELQQRMRESAKKTIDSEYSMEHMVHEFRKALLKSLSI